MRVRGWILTLAALCLTGLVVAAVSFGDVVGERGTQIISPPPGTTPPADGPSDAADAAGTPLAYNFDGTHAGSKTPLTDPIFGSPRPADNLEISQDNRVVRYAAFDSAATNLTSDFADGSHHHVYLFERNTGGQSTSELLGGKLTRLDKTTQANDGDSMKPSIDGQTKTGNGAVQPKCVVFQSTAKLTKADTGSKWSIYLYKISGGSLTLVSPPGADARDAVVDGQCQYITYESGGKVYVYWIEKDSRFELATGANPDQETDGKGAAYDRDGQVYYRSFTKYSLTNAQGQHFDALVPGPEILVSNSAADATKGGNGDSMMASVNDNGAYVAFESHATDLCGMPQRCQGVSTDRNGTKSDVFRRTLRTDAPTGGDHTARIRIKKPVKVKKGKAKKIRYVSARANVGNEMEMIDYDGAIDFQSDLDSDQVKLSGAGEQACFRSFGAETHDKKFASDGHQGPFMHIYFWNFPRERMIGKFTGESKAGRTSDTEFVRKDKTASRNWSCAISNRGNFIGWTSDEEDQSGEQNGRTIPDMFLRFMGGSDEGLGGDLGN